jgi:hypothetical protein
MSDAPAKDSPSSSSPPPSTSAASGTGGASVAPAAAAPSTDIVLLGPATADGGGVHVLRARAERLERGELRPLQEGRPVTGEIVTLAPREGNPRVCDVKESYAPLAPHKGKGPAKVATSAYRSGWDEIFGDKPTPDRSLN